MGIKKLNWKLNTELNYLLTFFDEEYTVKMGTDFEVDLDEKILYWSILYTEKSGDAFYKNFCKKFPFVKDFSLFTLAVFHEIGHIETEDEMEDDTDLRNTELSNEEYFNLHNEKIATEWAGNYINEHLMFTKYFDDKFTTILKNFYQSILDNYDS